MSPDPTPRVMRRARTTMRWRTKRESKHGTQEMDDKKVLQALCVRGWLSYRQTCDLLSSLLASSFLPAAAKHNGPGDDAVDQHHSSSRRAGCLPCCFHAGGGVAVVWVG